MTSFVALFQGVHAAPAPRGSTKPILAPSMGVDIVANYEGTFPRKGNPEAPDRHRFIVANV